MINLRYHIVSIAAVFLALGIGVALGSTFVDSVLVSNLESQVDQLQADTDTAIDRRAAAEAERDEALAELQVVSTDLAEIIGGYLPQGRLEGTTTLVMAPQSVDRDAVSAIRSLIEATRTRRAGVLWLSDGLSLESVGVRDSIAATFSLAGDSVNAVRRALRFLVPQALFRPEEARLISADSVSADGLAEPTALTLLAELGLIDHERAGAVSLSSVGGDGLRLVVVTDAAAAQLNETFVFDLLGAIAEDFDTASTVVVEVPAADDESYRYGSVADRLRSDVVLEASISSVDEPGSLSGRLALLVALERLPEVNHFTAAAPNHGIGLP